MNIQQARKQFNRDWKAWMKARRIRRAMDRLGCGRAGPAKAWYDECTVMMRRSRRKVMALLRRREDDEMAFIEFVNDGLSTWERECLAMLRKKYPLRRV